MVKKTESLREIIDQMWPKTKMELEKGLAQTKKILNKGEQYLKELSERGVAKTKKLSLNLKKEKLYYDLGKLVSKIRASQWAENKKIAGLLAEIKSLDRQISKIN